jgi:hypothetical protein
VKRKWAVLNENFERKSIIRVLDLLLLMAKEADDESSLS